MLSAERIPTIACKRRPVNKHRVEVPGSERAYVEGGEGAGIHFIQEDSADEVGLSLRQWMEIS